ncbi:MAG: SBBP repeat-containing protein [Vicinamibacterales bacterium]
MQRTLWKVENAAFAQSSNKTHIAAPWPERMALMGRLRTFRWPMLSPILILLVTLGLPMATSAAQAVLHPARYPDAPTGLAAVSVSATVKLKWHKVTSKIIGYKVERAASLAGPWTSIAFVDKKKTSYTDSTVVRGASYAYQVRATNTVGDSVPASVVVSGQNAPNLQGALAINGNAAFTAVTAVTLTLAASDPAGVTGYYISLIATPPAATDSGWTSIASTTSYDANLRYTLATGDGTRTLYAWYKNAAGSVSDTASAAILLDETAPTNGYIAAAAADGQISLSWSGFVDTGSGVAGSTYRLVFSTGSAPANCASGTVLATDSTSYVHTGLRNGTIYFYRVCVADNAGNVATGATASATPVGVQPNAFRSVKRFGGPASDAGSAVTVDGGGNIVVVGTFAGTADFGGPAALTSAGGSIDIFIVKYSPTGAYVCSRRIGSTSDDRVFSVKTDANGSIFVTGSFQGTVDFGGSVLTSNTSSVDAFVAKYPSTCGAVLWVRSLGASVDDAAYGLAVDRNGDVVVTGYFRGNVDFGGGVVPSNGSFADVFVAKYAGSNGAYQWARTLYGPSVDIGRGVAVDVNGNVVVTGSFQLTVSDGATYQPLMTSAGSVDFFLIKYSSTGNALWSRSFGGSGDDVAYGVDVDSGGNIAVVGSFHNTMDLGGGPLTSVGLADTFIAKFSPSGSHLWSTRIGGTSDDVDYAVAMDGAGNVVMTGGYQFTAGQWDIIVAKYSAAGAPLWSKTFGSTGNDLGFGIAVDSTGNVFVTGYFQGTIDFGGGPVTSSGLTDGFLLSLGP